jgi:rubrerythrin
MRQDLEETLIKTVGLALRASAMKKLYAQKAKQEGRSDVGHLLRVVAESESIQAHRLFNLLKGKIDLSENYITTVFEEEIEALIGVYSKNIEEAEHDGVPSIPEAMAQIRAAERRIRSFYSKEKSDVTTEKQKTYFVCKFCGYISVGKIPDSCPICTAAKDGFKEVL